MENGFKLIEALNIRDTISALVYVKTKKDEELEAIKLISDKLEARIRVLREKLEAIEN